ncbi:copper chaperone CopZ [Jeotgalibacillus soli]|uniref:Copper chaperone CopZ n=1 Tax=Jeotgalibacillus soli TaxID=889306 RepID=A0A0C2W6H3_9BACL|nr:copper chaperone CopZ [Jeotgalibacillus soli]KIL52176.1 copper chaperone CopZ [Jeotgalibacillus soli]
MVEHITLKVEGMSCQHCVKAIEGNVGNVAGVSKVDVHLDQGTVDVEFEKDYVSLDKIRNTIEEQGYDIA